MLGPKCTRPLRPKCTRPPQIHKFFLLKVHSISYILLMMQAKVVLRNWREENVRQSDDVVDLWEELLADAAVAFCQRALAAGGARESRLRLGARSK